MTTILNAGTATVVTGGLRGPEGPAGDLNVDGWEEVAAATVTDLSTTDSDFILITGAADIESFGITPNLIKICRTAVAPKLVYSTDLVTPGLADRQLQGGDWFMAMSDATGKWFVRIFPDEDLVEISELTTTGLMVRGGGGWFTRTITAPSNGLFVTNGDGVAGDPAIALADDIAAIEALSGTGFAARTAANAWAQRAITGTANEITLTNGDGVSGNPVVSLPNALTFTGKTVTGGTFDAPIIINLADPTNAEDAANKRYVDGIIAAQDAMVFKGVIDCSTNPNYPAADRGWTYRASAAGRIGGALGKVVETGDIILCLTDDTASGDEATVGSEWSVIQTNIDGALTTEDIGVTVQAYADNLAALAGLTSSADRLPYFTGAGTADLATLTAFARTILDDPDATTMRATLELGSIATQAAGSVAITGGTITGITDLAVADGGTGASTPSAARNSLGLAIGTDVQAHDATLDSLSSLGTAAGKIAYTTGEDAWAEADLTAFGRLLIASADAAAARTELGAAPLDSPEFTGTPIMPAYTTTTLPTAIAGGGPIYVSDGAAGSPVLAFSDGTDWLRCDDLTAVSAA